jgi:hypothetical protein
MMNTGLTKLLIASVLAGMTLVPISSGFADDDLQPLREEKSYRFVLTPKYADALNIVLPGNQGGGGFTSNLYTLKKGQLTGTFATNITSGELITNVLGALLVGPGAYVSVGCVRGVFETPYGTIVDRHSPTIFVTDETPKIFTSGGLVMVAVAEGDIDVTGGTMAFGHASGRTSLYLKFEVDPATFTAVARTGSFMFDIQRLPNSQSACQ